MQWLLYVSELIRYGRYAMPYDADSRFAPIAASDIALTAAKIFTRPRRTRSTDLHPDRSGGVQPRRTGRRGQPRAGQGPCPTSRSPSTTFLELIGQPDDHAKLKHFEAVTIDQQEGLLAGVDDAARTIAGQPLVTVEEFIDDNRAPFELHYPTAVA